MFYIGLSFSISAICKPFELDIANRRKISVIGIIPPQIRGDKMGSFREAKA